MGSSRVNANLAETNLVEIELECQEVYSGKLLKVQRDKVRLPNGKESFREYIRHPGACVVLAEKAPGVLIFERQFRYPLRREFLELPAGKLDPSDSPLECAQRELREETGYSAAHWKHLGTMHPCIGYSDERIEIFLAQGLEVGERDLDEGEFLDVFEMTLAEAETAVEQGLITDAKTIVGLFWARRVLA